MQVLELFKLRGPRTRGRNKSHEEAGGVLPWQCGRPRVERAVSDEVERNIWMFGFGDGVSGLWNVLILD